MQTSTRLSSLRLMLGCCITRAATQVTSTLLASRQQRPEYAARFSTDAALARAYDHSCTLSAVLMTGNPVKEAPELISIYDDADAVKTAWEDLLSLYYLGACRQNQEWFGVNTTDPTAIEEACAIAIDPATQRDLCRPETLFMENGCFVRGRNSQDSAIILKPNEDLPSCVRGAIHSTGLMQNISPWTPDICNACLAAGQNYCYSTNGCSDATSYGSCTGSDDTVGNVDWANHKSCVAPDSVNQGVNQGTRTVMDEAIFAYPINHGDITLGKADAVWRGCFDLNKKTQEECEKAPGVYGSPNPVADQEAKADPVMSTLAATVTATPPSGCDSGKMHCEEGGCMCIECSGDMQLPAHRGTSMCYQCPTDGAQVWCDENYDYNSYTLPNGTFAPTVEIASIITPAYISTPNPSQLPITDCPDPSGDYATTSEPWRSDLCGCSDDYGPGGDGGFRYDHVSGQGGCSRGCEHPKLERDHKCYECGEGESLISVESEAIAATPVRPIVTGAAGTEPSSTYDAVSSSELFQPCPSGTKEPWDRGQCRCHELPDAFHDILQYGFGQKAGCFSSCADGLMYVNGVCYESCSSDSTFNDRIVTTAPVVKPAAVETMVAPIGVIPCGLSQIEHMGSCYDLEQVIAEQVRQGYHAMLQSSRANKCCDLMIAPSLGPATVTAASVSPCPGCNCVGDMA